MKKAQTSSPQVLIRSVIQDQHILIFIKDNGPGISKAAQAKVFDPFFTTKAVGEGTGLGLSVTYNLVKKMGGRIQINSQEGKFCEFILTLPYQESTDNQAEQEAV